MENNKELTESPRKETPTEDLTSGTVPIDDKPLNITYDELAENAVENAQEPERLGNLSQEAEEKDRQMVDITNSQPDSVGLVSDLRQSLALLQSENTTIAQGKKEYYLKIIKLKTQIDSEHHQNEYLKLQVSDLQMKLKNSLKNEEGVRKCLFTAENEIKSQNESKRREWELLLNQKTDLEKERDSLSTTVQTLMDDLATHKNDVNRANERAKAAEERCHHLEGGQATIKRNHDELIEVYEKQRLEAEERIANFTTDVERTQESATAKQAQLEHENESLKNQLNDALERLQVSRNSLDQLFGKTNSSDDATTTDISTITPFGASGNVLKLMKQYEDTGKKWDDIYSDFFQLQDSASRLTAINTELTATNKQLVREKDDQQQYHNQLESEVERLRTERASQSSISDDLTKLKISSAHQISQLKNTIDKLEHTKHDLSTSLNDTSYQLRHLLQHVESQNWSLPSEIQQTNDLVEKASTPSSVSHEKTVFSNISELQQRNQELMSQVHHLSAQLEEKTTEANKYAISAKDANALLTDTSAKATTLIHEQNEKLKALELRLSMMVSERDRLKKETPESNLDSIVPTSAGDIHEQLKSMEQKHQELATETDAYRQEVEVEIQELRQEIKKSSMEAMDMGQKYNQSLSEIDQLKQRNIGLLQVSSSRQNEIEQLRKRATVREGYVGELEDRILNLKDEIMTLNRNIENLHSDNLSTSAQLQASNDSYQRLLLENKELANHRTHMAALLQDMNESLGSSTSGATTLIEELRLCNERLSDELQDLRDTLTAKEKQLGDLRAMGEQRWKDRYQAAHGELKQLKAEYLALEKKLADANQNRLASQRKLDEIAQNTQNTSVDDPDTTGTIDKNETDDDALSEQTKQLAEATDLAISLKKELFDLKEQLADAESTTNIVTEKYNIFTNESQIRIDKLSNDLTTSNAKVDGLQLEMEKMLTEQKELVATYISAQQQLESTNANLVKENQEWQTKVTMLSNRITDLETELASNVQQLQQIEQRYQGEVSARDQDAEIITKLRGEVDELNTSISTYETQLQDAKDRLEAAETSYKYQKEQWESVENDMKIRLEEYQKQQESLSANIQELVSKLNQSQSTPESVDPKTITNLVDGATQQIRDVIASLRREKDVWKARYADAQQRATHAESDLEFIQQQLSTARVLLDTTRAEKDDAIEKQRKGIKDAANEASLYKENNVVLRNKIQQLEEHIAQLESLVATKESELEPLTSNTQELKQELEKSRALIKTLQTKQEEWSLRNTNVSPIQNKQDSRELDQLKSEIEAAKSQLEEKVKTINSLEKQHHDAVAKANRTEEQLKKKEDMYVQRSKLALEFKKKAEELEATVKAQKEQLDGKQKEQPDEQQRKQEPDSSEKLRGMEEALKNQKEENNALAKKFHSLLLKARQMTTEKKTLSTRLEEAEQGKKTLTERNESLEAEIEQLKQQLTTKSDEAATLQVEIGRMKAMLSMANNKSEKMKKQVTELQQKLEGQAPPVDSSLPNTTKPNETPSSTSNDTISTAITTLTPTDSTNVLKRSPEDDLDGQSPTKK